jgi:hypothetical protein
MKACIVCNFRFQGNFAGSCVQGQRRGEITVEQVTHGQELGVLFFARKLAALASRGQGLDQAVVPQFGQALAAQTAQSFPQLVDQRQVTLAATTRIGPGLARGTGGTTQFFGDG